AVPVTGSDEVLSSQLTLDFGFAFGVTDWLTFAFDVPVQRAPLGAAFGKQGLYRPVDPATARPGTGFYSVRPDQNVQPSENAPGDVRVGLKLRLTGRGDWGIGVALVGYAPFGDEDVFGGGSGGTFEPKLLLERRLGTQGVIALNGGVRLRHGTLVRTRQTDAAGMVMNDSAGQPVYFPLLYVGSEAIAGIGARYQFTPLLGVGVERYALIPSVKTGAVECSGMCKNGDLTGDVLGGIYLSPSPDVTITVAGGTGIAPDAARRDAFRVTAGVAWTPSAEGTAVQGDRDG